MNTYHLVADNPYAQELDPREQRVVAEITQFARESVLPSAARMDALPAGNVDWDLVREGSKLGLLRLAIPQDMGGHGLGTSAVSIIMEELAAADPGVALIFGASGLFHIPIMLSGNQRLLDKYLTPFLGDEPVLACNAVAEEMNGTDLVLPQHAEYATEMTTARLVGDEYLLTGKKKYITCAPVASFAAVMANLEGEPGSTGLTCFIVDLEQEGVSRGETHDKVGYRAAPAGELIFRDAVVPTENVIGGERGGWGLNVLQGNLCRITCAAVATGIARHAFTRAYRWCGQRRQGGRFLYQHQMSARKLADMAARVTASRSLYVNAAGKADNELPTPEYEPAVAKLIADRAAIDNAEAAMALIGAQAFQRGDGTDKVLRDAFGPRIYEGTPEALALVITEGLYEEYSHA